MKELAQKFPKEGDIIEGIIVGKGRSAVYLDLGLFGTGIIYGKEYLVARDLLKNCDNGEKILAKITSLENEDGYVELSANKAGQEFAWETIKEKKEKEELIKIKVLGANKGGLLTKIMNLQAFLPVSQLSSQNYPKVDGGDSMKILRELQKFIGTELEVRILDFDKNEDKLIVSERVKEMEKIRELLKDYEVGNVVDVKVTSLADFGAFVSFGEEELEGLIHISEMTWQIIKDPVEVVNEGDVVKAKIIEINNDRVFLSLKALEKNPWEGIDKKYKEGDVIKGKVTKMNPFGAFVLLGEKQNLQGLCHVSGFSSPEKMSEELEVDKEYNFEIVSLEPEEFRIILKPKK